MYAGKNSASKWKGMIFSKGYAKILKVLSSSSSHIGNYEIAGYSLPTEEKRFNALVFGGEKESVMTNRNRLFKETTSA